MITDAVEILHRRHFDGKPEAMALLDEAREEAVREDERERCCRDLCVYCRNEDPVAASPSGRWFHKIGPVIPKCLATRIRERAALEIT